MKPNELPPHIKKYFMDYVNVYEIMDQLAAQDKIILGLKNEIERQKLLNTFQTEKLTAKDKIIFELRNQVERQKNDT